MSDARNVAPWLVFTTVSLVANWRVAAPAALAACVVNALARHRSGAAGDELALAAMALFGALTMLSGADPTSGMRHYIPSLTAAAIGSAMAASIVRRRPFTVAFAKRSTSPAIWDDPRFLRANALISGAWAASTLAMGATLAMLRVADPHAVLAAVGVQIAGFVLPMRFTKMYRTRLRSQFAAA